MALGVVAEEVAKGGVLANLGVLAELVGVLAKPVLPPDSVLASKASCSPALEPSGEIPSSLANEDLRPACPELVWMSKRDCLTCKRSLCAASCSARLRVLLDVASCCSCALTSRLLPLSHQAERHI